MRNYMRLLLAFLIMTTSSCGQSSDSSTWKSSHRLLSFAYKDPWKRLPTLDTEKETLTGVIDYSDGKSYVIKIGHDVSKEKLPDNTYYANVKETMLAPNAANRLLFEGDTVFHSQQSHRLDFLMNTDKWGWMRQVSIIRRDGKEFFSVQISYPIRQEEIYKEIPDEIIEFDKSVRLNNK